MEDINSELKEKFVQWMIVKGKAKQELTSIFVYDNGNFKIEKKMAWVIKTTPSDWREFCNENDVKHEELKLLAIY